MILVYSVFEVPECFDNFVLPSKPLSMQVLHLLRVYYSESGYLLFHHFLLNHRPSLPIRCSLSPHFGHGIYLFDHQDCTITITDANQLTIVFHWDDSIIFKLITTILLRFKNITRWLDCNICLRKETFFF